MQETQVCTRCGEEKALSLYYRGKSKKTGLRPSCKSCDADTQRKWADSNVEKRKRRDRRVNLLYYGLTFSDFDTLMALGGGRCWICKTEPGRRQLDVDHVHGEEPVVVRGLLCASCNVGIGLAHNSPETLEALAQYVEQAQQREVDWFRTEGPRHARTAGPRPLTVKRPRWNGPTPEGQKRCPQCEKFLPHASFYPAKAGKLRLSAYCRECATTASRLWDAQHTEGLAHRSMKARLKLRFDVTPDEYAYLNALQHGVCAACGRADAQGERLAVDHDRSRGHRAVRGLLCRHCNIGLGALKDSPALLRAAYGYLRNAEGRGPFWWGESTPDGESPRTNVKVSGADAVERARVEFLQGTRTRGEIAEGFGITVQAAGDLLRGRTWKKAGGPLVVDPGEHTVGWSSRERGDAHWTRRKNLHPSGDVRVAGTCQNV